MKDDENPVRSVCFTRPTGERVVLRWHAPPACGRRCRALKHHLVDTRSRAYREAC